MAAWTAVARQSMNIGRLSSPKSASLVHRRGMAGSADPHGTPKVNIWQDPLSPSKWKEEHALRELENSTHLYTPDIIMHTRR
ncbi:hypothetical protein MTR_2g080270 [Medicago truncatula]|uniref:Uncharacterized protein n=1 Tax=Medicago truncatula TaxID=3880 RepID=A0A072VL00_MEDTR|nr:hypothetical protein MTR_2g080270 [Medicago truncatula]